MQTIKAEMLEFKKREALVDDNRSYSLLFILSLGLIRAVVSCRMNQEKKRLV